MARRTVRDTTIGARIAEKRKQRKWSVRHAASRAGIDPSTWSRIERGLQATNNLFVLSDIAAALECLMSELTGAAETAPRDPKLVTARASVRAIRGALVEADLDEPPLVEALPLAALEREVALVRDLKLRCDYAGASQRLPHLIRHLHAAVHGPEWETALRLMASAGNVAWAVVKNIGYPGEAWLAAERIRHAAQRLDDPVMTGYAAMHRAFAAWQCGVYKRANAYATRAVDALTAHAGDGHAAEVLGFLLLVAAHTAYGDKRPGDGAEYYAEAERMAERTGETTTFDLFFGPTNVAYWQVGTLADSGEPDEAVRVALDTNPAMLTAPMHQVFFHMDTARALAYVGRHDTEAERHIMTAERVAPQLVRASPVAIETARELRDRIGGSALRGLCERMGMPD